MTFLRRLCALMLAILMMSIAVVEHQALAQKPMAPPTNTPHSLGSTSTADLTSTSTPRPSRTPTNTRTPTSTRTPTATPTPAPTMVILGTYTTPVLTPVTPIPPAAPVPSASGDDVVTILLLGSDNLTPGVISNTDTLVLVAIDRTANTVTMMHLARDTFVYAPNHTMMKLNTVMLAGAKDGPDGGEKLLKQTIQYNYGIKVDFYAHVNFQGFQQIILRLGGLDLSVDCAIQGHRLKSTDLDPTREDSYELYTLPVGYRHLDPYMALWYVRSRGSSSDIDRGRRQMDVLRAIWRQAKQANQLAQVTQLWSDAQKIVQTDMTLPDVLGLVPFALSLDPTNIQRINVDLTIGYTLWYTADVGEYALTMKPSIWRAALQNFVLPPDNRLGGESPTVEIGAALPLKGYDQVAADRLAWDGFSTKAIGSEGVVNRTNTVIIDHTGGAKPSSLAALMKTLRVNKAAVMNQPDPNRTTDFRVEMGKDYGQCIYTLPPEYQDTPVPAKP